MSGTNLFNNVKATWDLVPEGSYVVDARHGNARSVQVNEMVWFKTDTGFIPNERTTSINHRTLWKILKSKGLKRGTRVTLYFCESGMEENGIAQNLANKIGGKGGVEGASTSLWARRNGRTTIAPRRIFSAKPSTLWKGEFRTFYPKKCTLHIDRTDQIVDRTLKTVSIGICGLNLAGASYILYDYRDDIASYAPHFYNFMSSPPLSYLDHDLFDPTDTDLFDYTHSDLNYPDNPFTISPSSPSDPEFYYHQPLFSPLDLG